MRTGVSWLDFKLGARMLIKYPGLTLVGGLGMAVAIAIGAGFFTFAYSFLRPTTLPLAEGERVVGIHNWDAARNYHEPRSLHDFVTWREELESVQSLGAFREVRRNLILPGGAAEPVPLAEMSASGFRVARVPPMLGRPLVEADEATGAPTVVVIGYDVWRTRFQGDPAVVGTEVRLGSRVHTVVGVMPEGFAFPVNHRFWVPLRADPAEYERREGPAIRVFGRLAPGATLDEAQAELTAIGRRTAAAFPGTHERLRPRVMPYTALWYPEDRLEVYLLQLLVGMLLVVVCANVAILVYARTAMREGEITVRTALGASRGRIVAQLFVEALVLSVGAAAVGLGLARLGLREWEAILEQRRGGGLPFWVDFDLSAGTLVYALGLAVLAAVIVGVVPASQATGRRLESRLRQLGGGTGMRMGRTWTALVIAQLAIAVAVLPAAVFMAWQTVEYGIATPGFAADEFLTARIEMDRETPPSAEAAAYEQQFTQRLRDRLVELERRLESEPGISAVTFASDVPGSEPTALYEVEGVPPPAGSPGSEARAGRIAADYLDAFEVPVLAGRPLHSGDAGATTTTVVVNRAFAQQLLGGANAVGRRVRKAGLVDDDEGLDTGEPGPWYEIVGVVGNLPANPTQPGLPEARMYHAAPAGEVHPVTLLMRVGGGAPAGFSGRLRKITTALDPSLELREVVALDEVYRQQQAEMRMTALALAMVTLCVLLLSAAGIYALVSFTVAQRRREIGIRSALGAHPRQIVLAIFSRALRQIGAGVALGVVVASLLDGMTLGSHMGGRGTVILPGVAVLMLGVGLLAALGPARRGLRIEPTEALKAEG